MTGQNAPLSPDWDYTVGPRRVGGRYLSGYWGEEYTVLAIKHEYGGWWITEATDAELAEGKSRTHCTAWDDFRDKVIRQPDETAGAAS